MRIVLSYAHGDKNQATTVRTYLEDAGHEVWHDHRNLTAGQDWRVEARNHIQKSDAVVVFWTFNSRQSEAVAFELKQAAELNVPVLALVKMYGLETDQLAPTPDHNPSQIDIRFNMNLTRSILEDLRNGCEEIGNAKGRVISFLNFKGGVGKTTIAAMTGWAFAARRGKRVLLIDLDPQESLTDVVLARKSIEDSQAQKRTSMALFEPGLLGDAAAPDYELKLGLPLNFDYSELGTLPIRLFPDLLEECRLDVIPSDARMVKYSQHSKEAHGVLLDHFKHLLAKYRRQYDLIILDCGPSASFLTHAVLRAADAVIAPLRSELTVTRGIPNLCNLASEFYNILEFPEKLWAFYNMFEEAMAYNRGRYDQAINDPASVLRYPNFKVGHFLKSTVRSSYRLINSQREFIDNAPPFSVNRGQAQSLVTDLDGLASEIWTSVLGNPPDETTHRADSPHFIQTEETRPSL